MTKHIIFQVHFMKNGNIFKSRKVGERLPTLSTSYCLDSYSLFPMFMSDASIIFSKPSYLCHRIV